MYKTTNEYLELHSRRIHKEINDAEKVLGEFKQRLESAEVEFPENKGKGKAYVIQQGWMEAQAHCFRLQGFYRHMDTIEQDRRAILKVLLGKAGEGVIVKPSITFDFGKNIYMDNDSFLNMNVTILDWAPVYIGEGTKIGSDSKLYTVKHSFCPKQRKDFILTTNPLIIERNVWISGNCTILGGISIGENSIIGAGAIITKDIPKNVIVVGNNRILRKLSSEEISSGFAAKSVTYDSSVIKQ